MRTLQKTGLTHYTMGVLSLPLPHAWAPLLLPVRVRQASALPPKDARAPRPEQSQEIGPMIPQDRWLKCVSEIISRRVGWLTHVALLPPPMVTQRKSSLVVHS